MTRYTSPPIREYNLGESEIFKAIEFSILFWLISRKGAVKPGRVAKAANISANSALSAVLRGAKFFLQS